MRTVLLRTLTRSKALMSLVILTLLSSLGLYAQTLTPHYVTTITANSGGFYESLPKDYATGTAFPVILQIHGVGSLGSGSTTELPKVTGSGPIRLIRDKVFPTSFTVDGKTFEYIVIAPQFIEWPSPQDLDKYVEYIRSHYKIDRSRFYLTGWSMGGGATWDYVGNNPTYASKIAAIVPVCGASYPDMTRSRIIAAANIPVWATHNSGDPTVTVQNTIGYVGNINQAPAPTPLAHKEIFTSTVHDAWSKTYSLAYTWNGLNIYEWMLQYKKGTTEAVASLSTNQAPKANAGSDKTITLPLSSTTLSGSATDADGSIASYSWSKISGPSQFSLSSTTVPTPTLSNLVAGTYTFRLSVKDNAGASSYDEVMVTVNAAPNQAPKVYAGADQSLTLPSASTTLKGSASDADGTIAAYQWRELSGPSQGVLSNASAVQSTLSALLQGRYSFELQVKDNLNAISKDTVVIVVNAATSTTSTTTTTTTTLSTSSVTKYIKVNVYGGTNPYSNTAWNNWNVGTTAGTNLTSTTLKYADGSASSIQAVLSYSQSVGDNGATYSGGMAPAEVLRYTSYAAQTRTLTLKGLSPSKKYNVELYASRYSVGNSTIFTVNAKSDTVAVYDNYSHAAAYSSLTPDAQGEVVITLKPGTNYSHFNGFVLTEQGSTATAATATVHSSTEELQAAARTTLAQLSASVYPNPAQNQVQLQFTNEYLGRVQVQVLSLSGSVVKSFSAVKDQPFYSQSVEVSALAAGTYLLRVQVGNWSTSCKVVKL